MKKTGAGAGDGAEEEQGGAGEALELGMRTIIQEVLEKEAEEHDE